MTAGTLTTKQLANKLDHDGIYIHYGIIQGATDGDTSCQVVIGDLFYGNHQFKDAMDWYELAASKNDAKAQYKVGKLYQKGGGVAVDYKLAMDWYLKAAAQNNSKARKAIGGLFENGLGVPVDKDKANDWYNKGSSMSWFKGLKTKPIDDLVKEAQQVIKKERCNNDLKQNSQENTVNKTESLEEPNQDLENRLERKDQKISDLENEIDTLHISTDQMKAKLEHLEMLVQNTNNSSTRKQQESNKETELNVLKEKNREVNQRVEELERLLQKAHASNQKNRRNEDDDNNDLYYISSSSDNEED